MNAKEKVETQLFSMSARCLLILMEEAGTSCISILGKKMRGMNTVEGRLEVVLLKVEHTPHPPGSLLDTDCSASTSKLPL